MTPNQYIHKRLKGEQVHYDHEQVCGLMDEYLAQSIKKYNLVPTIQEDAEEEKRMRGYLLVIIFSVIAGLIVGFIVGFFLLRLTSFV